MKKIRFDSADGAAQDAGDLLVRQIVIHAQDQRGALLLRQPRDRGTHPRGALPTLERRVHRFDPWIRPVDGVEWKERSERTRTDAVQTYVNRHPVEPRAERGVAF